VVGEKFPNSKKLVIGAFLFLRFIVPALVTPQEYGLLDGNGSPLAKKKRMIKISVFWYIRKNSLPRGNTSILNRLKSV